MRGGNDAGDAYADAARARIYISAVDRILTSEDLAKFAGIKIDEFREVVDAQLCAARTRLASTEVRPTAACRNAGGDGSGRRQQPVPAFVRTRPAAMFTQF